MYMNFPYSSQSYMEFSRENQGKSGGVPASGSKKTNTKTAINGIIIQQINVKMRHPLINLFMEHPS